jgi:ubiquinone/menaquinone biosynthesis C-methylase UbiE
VAGGNALEVGCGRGVGIDIILDTFGAGTVDGVDLDPDMVTRARARHRFRGDRVRLWVGDVEHIEAADATYDAVFDFAIIHHVPAWRNALHEVARVLKPGGRFYAEEVLARFINHPVWRALLEHPKQDRFDRRGFEDGLTAAGLKVVGSNELLGQFAWFVAEKR